MPKEKVELSITIKKDSPDIPTILDGINSYTKCELGKEEDMSLYEICLKNEQKQKCGGIAFQIVYGVLYIDILWADFKVDDVGAVKLLLLYKAHSFAKAKGCNMSTIHSMSFEGNQLFLQGQGYQLGAELKGFSHGHVKNSYFRSLDDINPMTLGEVKAVSHSDESLKFLTAQYNASYPSFPIANYGVIVKNPHGQVVGGASVYVKFGSVELDLLWLEKNIRGQKVGSKVMGLIHEFAKAQGANISTLCTMSDDNATEFYEKLGYRVYYEKDGYAGSSVRYSVRDLSDIQPLEPGVGGVTMEVSIEQQQVAGTGAAEQFFDVQYHG